MNAVDLDTRVCFPARLHVSSRADRHLLFAQDRRVCVVVNDAGREVFEAGRGETTPRLVARAIASRHSAPAALFEERVRSFVGRMLDAGILTRTGDTPPPGPATARGDMVEPLGDVYLHLTDHCNLRCVYCYNADYRLAALRARSELKITELRRVVDELAELRVERLVFTGGEPMCRAGAVSLAHHARERGMSVSLLTNGTLLAGRAREVAGAFDSVIVSLDSCRPDEHDRLRGAGTFERIVKGVRELTSIGGPRVALRPVITRQNVRALGEFPAYAAAVLGCTDFMLAPYLPCSARDLREGRDLLPSPQEYGHALVRFADALNEVGGSSSFEVEPLEASGRCGAGNGIVSIAANGDVFPCQCLHREQFCAGNVRQSSLRKIYDESEVFRAFRERQRTQRPQFAACGDCPISSICTYACWAVHAAFEESQDEFTDRMCRFALKEADLRLWKAAERACSETAAIGSRPASTPRRVPEGRPDSARRPRGCEPSG